MKKEGFLRTAWKKAIVSIDDKLADKIEQYVKEATDMLDHGREPNILHRMKFVGVYSLKEPIEALRNRLG